ncbi:MAG: hypothetical protein WDN25_15815 [Acetobacteraceae bacterium]
MLNTGKSLVLAIHQVTTAALPAVAAISAEKADTDALPDALALNACAEQIDDPDGLMARDTRPCDENIPCTVAASE